MARQALERADEQQAQPLGEVGALEELARVAVLQTALVTVDLAQVGGEFGLLVAPARDIGVWRDKLAPRTQTQSGRSIKRGGDCFLLLALHLLLKTNAEHLLFLAVNLGGLLGGTDREQQALDAIKGAVGVVKRKSVLVRPTVARIAALVDERAVIAAKLLTKDLIPLTDHHSQHGGRIPITAPPALAIVEIAAHRLVPRIAVGTLQLALEEGLEAGVQQFQSFPDAVVVGDGHWIPRDCSFTNDHILCRICAVNLQTVCTNRTTGRDKMHTDKYRGQYRVDSTRLATWDYSRNAAYFITICAHNHVHIFGEVVHNQVALTPLGQAAWDCWFAIPEHFPFVLLDTFVAMPNHVHGIVIINKPSPVDGDGNGDVETQYIASLPSAPSTPPKNQFGPQSQNLASIVRGFKIGVTKYARQNHLACVWQPRYYDHIVRNAADHHRIRKYILDNPRQWALDTFHSS